MVVEKLRQLLAQALVLLALVTEQHGALKQLLLQIMRQFAPQIRRGGTEHEQVASGNVVDDLIGMFAHWRTHNCKELINCKMGALAQSPLPYAAYQKPRAPSAILGPLST
jgi:hypothetical protein